MLPYEQIKAQADQRFARYEADAHNRRLIERRGVSDRDGFRFRFRLSRMRRNVLGDFSGPVQPAI
jgi:hypothetical protein